MKPFKVFLLVVGLFLLGSTLNAMCVQKVHCSVTADNPVKLIAVAFISVPEAVTPVFTLSTFTVGNVERSKMTAGREISFNSSFSSPGRSIHAKPQNEALKAQILRDNRGFLKWLSRSNTSDT